MEQSLTSVPRLAAVAATGNQTQLTVAQTNLMQADVGQVSTQLSLAETQQNGALGRICAAAQAIQ